MARKITIANSKGGVGKTTVTTLLSYHLSTLGYKVLLIDLDPQGSSTFIINNSFYEGKFQEKEYTTLYEGLESKDLKKCIYDATENFSFIPSELNTVDFIELLNENNKFTYLSKLVNKIEDDYDFIFYDVPPTVFTDFINNALVSSDYYIIVTDDSNLSFKKVPDMYALGQKLSTINKNLKFLSILINRRERYKDVMQKLIEEYQTYNEDMFFQTVIPQKKRISKYADEGIFSINKKRAFKYDQWDKEIIDIFNSVVEELFNKIKKEEGA